jgi:hypothetical protein
MPDGVDVEFPDDMPRERISAIIRGKFPDAVKQLAAPDDHGLARRQAMSGPEKVLSPITEYPRNYDEMRKEAQHQMSTGVGQLKSGLLDHGIAGDVPEFVSGLGNTALGALGYVGSPISAAYRSVIGQPIEDVTGIPREYTEFGAQLATPGIGLPRMPGGVNVPGYRPVPGTTGPGAPVNPTDLRRVMITKDDPPGSAPSGTDTALAMQRLREQGIDIDVPRAITTENTSVQRAGQGVSHTPLVGDPLARTIHEKLPGQIEQARDVLANQQGVAEGPTAAGSAARYISEKAAAEAAAAEAAAAQRNAGALSTWESANAGREARVAAHEARSASEVEAQTGRVNPQDTGAAVRDTFREADRAAKANVRQLYDVAGETEGTIKREGVQGIHDRIKNDLLDADINIDYPSTTGTSINMMKEIEKFERGEFPGAKPVKVAPAAPKAAVEAAAPQGQSLNEFLASKGGLRPDQELGAIGADRHLVNIEGTGKRRLVKQGGWPLDTAREAAEEAGYLPKGSTPNDMLDMIDAEMRGNKRFAEGFEGSVSSREAMAASERARAELSSFRRGLEDDLAKAGHGEMGPKIKARTLKIMEDERIGPDEAVEKALRQLDQEDAVKAGGTPGGFPGDRLSPWEGVSLQGVERFRKNLRSVAKGAERGSEDERAARHIISKFDDWQQDAMQTALLSGDEKALEKFKQARAANREWRENFGYNERNDVNNLAQKVLHQDVTPNEVANYLIGSGKVGSQGTTSRLYDSLMKATGNNEDLAKSIQGAIWDRLSSSPTAAKDIREFVHKSGRDLAEKVFPQGSRELMLRHADILDKAKAARELSADMAKGSKPKPVDAEKGPMQQLAARVIGGKMDKEEALWSAIKGYTTEKGDSKALAQLVREIPPDMKGDIAGAVIRGLGKDRAGNFSLDIFASDWSKVSPRARAILFGDSAHAGYLDDIATIANRLKNVKKNYGNSSGTAQTTAFQQLSALFATTVAGNFAPLPAATAVGGAIAGNLGARYLAKPASAASIAKYARALEVAEKSPGPSSQALVSMTERNLLNTIKTLGASRAPPSGQGMRLLQGPVPAGAENEKR